MAHMSKLAHDVDNLLCDGLTVDEIASILNISEAQVEECICEAEEAYHAEADAYEDAMDGDEASALASAGWGTDEDYGYADEVL